MKIYSNNPNFLSIHINYPPGAGVLTALGKETMSGQQRREGAIKAMKIGNVIAKKLESKYNLEDIEVSDSENGKVTVFAVSDDFINMKSPSIDEEVTKSEEEKLKKISKELKGASKMHASQSKKIAKLVKEKLTKKSSVEDHVEDFKDSNAPQFKGKSKDKKVQMAVAAYLSKQDKKKVDEGFKVGDKVTYLGHPAEITKANKDVMDRISYSVSYDKGNGKTKASNIFNKDGEIKASK